MKPDQQPSTRRLAGRAKVMAGGKLVLPAELRRAAGIAPGDTVTVELDGETLRVMSLLAQIRRAQELIRPFLPTDGRSIVDEFIAEKREEAAREDAEAAAWRAERRATGRS
jgi:bifunctional DNA-binding transcriptional regulator/antitoxin component of YhaV-PrlF toxin-antitoxin module